MKQSRVLASFSMILVAVCSSGQTSPDSQIKLWAAIGVAKPVFHLSEMDTMALSFVVVNDGPTTAAPEVESSRLFINGVEPKDWSFVIGNGLRSTYFTALPPGQTLGFGYQLGPRYFTTPGIYTLRWEGPNFKAPELAFRVMP